MQVGNRIIYNQDGEIMTQLGEMQGDVLLRKEITKLHYIDLEYASINHQTHRIIGIDVETQQPILETIEVIETEDQKRIRDLEDALLLAADAEMGGIL